MTVQADPWAGPGDLVLRQDIQRLADAGGGLGGRYLGQRVSARLENIRGVSGLQPSARAAVASDPFWLRTFESTPRDDSELATGVSWMGDRFAVRIEGSYRHDAEDGQDWRMDNSFASFVIGNHILSAGAVDRWWGPGWESGLLLTSNARPVAGFTLERNVAMPFETRWLSWIGPWNYTLHWGFLGDDRFRSGGFVQARDLVEPALEVLDPRHRQVQLGAAGPVLAQ